MFVCEGSTDRGEGGIDLPMTFDELSGDEALSIDEALRLGLSPLDLNDIAQLTEDANCLFSDPSAEEQLRLDHSNYRTPDNYYRPL